ncbi:hypothetical protein CANCADRAFT_21266, partial [Tortispora caseinolytica NRRL Y-17796]
LDKQLIIQLNSEREIIGVLKGYDVFLNLVLDEVVESKKDGERISVGTAIIRGNSIITIEALDNTQ